MQIYFAVWFEANQADFDYNQDLIDMCGGSVGFLDVVLVLHDVAQLLATIAR
jgi:hypothetical protein